MRPLHRVVRFFSAAWLGVVSAGIALAQMDPETALVKQLGSPNILQLREQAQKLLEANPGSVAARLALSHVAEERDRVDEALRQAHLAWEAARRLPPEPGAKAPSFPALALYRLCDLLGNLDRRQEQLQWLEEYDRRACFRWESQSGIRYPAARLKVIALLKLGRIDQARRFLDEVEADPARRGLSAEQLAMDRIRVEGVASRDSREAARRCLDLEKEMRTRGRQIAAGYLMNFAQWAARQGELERALDLYREAGQAVESETRFNPFQRMAEVYIARSEWDRARTAVAQAWKVIKLKKPAVRLEMTRALRLTVSRFYSAYGSPDKALEHLESAYGEPQRMRDSLESATQAKAQAVYGQAVALRDFWGLFGGTTGPVFERWVSAPGDFLRVWECDQKLAGLISAQFAESLAPRDALAVVSAVFPSQWADVPRVLGTPFARHLLENPGLDDAWKSYAPFFRCLSETGGTAVQTEVALARDALPDWDRNGRARMEVILAGRSASPSEALDHYVAAWRLHAPSLIGSKLPMVVHDSGGNQEVCVLVSHCPSIRATQAGTAFGLDVGDDRAVLRAPDGAELRTFALPAGPASVRAAAVLRAVFSAGAPLTEQDMLALDGRVLLSAKEEGQK